MGRSPCCEKEHTNKGAWTKEEDQRLIAYIKAHGEGCWRSLPKAAGTYYTFSLSPSLPLPEIYLCFFFFGMYLILILIFLFIYFFLGLLRCGKSCRLRWINYLRPDLKRGNFTDEEDELIINLHSFFGNKYYSLHSYPLFFFFFFLIGCF